MNLPQQVCLKQASNKGNQYELCDLEKKLLKKLAI